MPTTDDQNVLSFPTRRKAGYRSPPGRWKRPLPANVTMLRRPLRRPALALPPLAYVVLALIEALREEPARWKKTGGPDVLGHLQRLQVRYQDDAELEPYLHEALRIVLARRTGRI